MTYAVATVFVVLYVFLSRTSADIHALVSFSIVLFALLIILSFSRIPRFAFIFGIAVTIRLFFVDWLPGLSDDAYRYIWDGLLSANGLNPFESLPSDPALAAFQGDFVYDQLNSKDYFTVYPPLSQLIFWMGGSVYESGWQSSYFVIKGILLGFELGSLYLLGRLISPQAFMLFAWHPLVVLESAGQAHTEAVMVFFLVLTIWLHRRRDQKLVATGIFVGAALAAAGFVKLYPFVLFPLLWRRYGWKALLGGGLVAVILLVPFVHPSFISNYLDSLNLYVKLFEFNAGPYYFVKEVFYFFTDADWSKWIGPFFRNVFLLLVAVFIVLDWKFKWTLEKSFFLILAAFILLSTTVHPWYLLGPLVLASLLPSVHWHWHWLAAFSLGSYFLYSDGPYWLFVWLAWSGWFLTLLYLNRETPWRGLQALQQFRARQKFNVLQPFLPTRQGARVLDLGAGEGYVGAAIQDNTPLEVLLADVIAMNRTSLPHIQYDGSRLPLGQNEVDTTVLYFVLHHCKTPEDVLSEAIRVSKQRIIIVESVYESDLQHRVLRLLDTLANRIRSAGAMRAQEEFLHFRDVPAWKDQFLKHHLKLIYERRFGSPLHRQHLFILEK